MDQSPRDSDAPPANAVRSVSSILPHLISLSTLAVFCSAYRKLEPVGIGVLRFLVALCALCMAYGYDGAHRRAPRWLFAFIFLVFLFPVEPVISYGGWLVIALLTGFATMVQGNEILLQVPRSAVVTTVNWIFSIAVWASICLAFGMWGWVDPNWRANFTDLRSLLTLIGFVALSFLINRLPWFKEKTGASEPG